MDAGEHHEEAQSSSRPPPSGRLGKIISSLPLAVIAALYFVLACTYNVLVPPWEAPDEVGHFQYVVHLAQERSLPRMELGQLGEAHQPPLYYVLAALAAAPADLDDTTGACSPNPRFVYAEQGGREVNLCLHDAGETGLPHEGWALGLHLTRACSSMMGLGTVLLTYAIARRVLSGDRAAALLAAGLVAFNPQFLFISASVSNDNLLALVSAGLLWHTLVLAGRLRSGDLPSSGQWLGSGGLMLALVLTKMTGLAIIGAAVLGLLYAGWRGRRLRPVVMGLLLTLLVVGVGSSWWWLRNQALYGDPLGQEYYEEVFRVNLRTTPLTLSDLQAFRQTQFRSFWGVFGWMTVGAPGWFYDALKWAVLAALGGWVVRAVHRRRSPGGPSTVGLAALALLLVAAVLQEAFLLVVIQRADVSMWQGRYLFPVVSAVAVVLAGGLAGWVPLRFRAALSLALVATLVVVAVYMVLGVIRPAYARQPTANEVAISNPLQFTVGDQFLLQGYDLEHGPLAVTITLYWEALRTPDFDYSVFVHLLDESGEFIGQQDHAPGSDRNHPPTTWRPGEVIADSHRVSVGGSPEGILVMRVGVYNWSNGARLAVNLDGEPVGDMVVVEVGSHDSAAVPIAIGVGLVATAATGLLLWRRHRSLVGG